MHSVTLGDVDSDDYIDVVVGISLPNGEGQVWALNAATGEPLDGFPVELGNRRVGEFRVMFALGDALVMASYMWTCGHVVTVPCRAVLCHW